MKACLWRLIFAQTGSGAEQRFNHFLWPFVLDIMSKYMIKEDEKKGDAPDGAVAQSPLGHYFIFIRALHIKSTGSPSLSH